MHLTIIIVIAAIALTLIVLLYSGYPQSILRAESRKLLLLLPIVVAYFGVAFWIIVEGFHRPLNEVPDISVSILWTVVFSYYVIDWISSSQRSGNLIFDICSIPNRFAYIALAVIFLVLGFISDFFYFVGAPYARYASIVLGISLAFVFLRKASSRLQVRETGFWVYGHLKLWEKIECFDIYRDKNKQILRLVYKDRMPTLLRTSTLVIPAKKKSRLLSLLESHLPNKLLIEKSA